MRRGQSIYYQYKADRARRTLRGINEQVAKAAKAVAGLAPVKRNRFIALDGATKSINRELEAKARTLAGIKGYVTNLAACPDGTPVTADFVIGELPQAFRDQEKLRHVQVRPAGQAHLPPQARLHRGPPHDCLRRAGGRTLDRATDRLVNQKIRQDSPTLPRHRDPGRTADQHRHRPHDLLQALETITRNGQGAHWFEPTRGIQAVPSSTVRMRIPHSRNLTLAALAATVIPGSTSVLEQRHGVAGGRLLADGGRLFRRSRGE
jgi:hypothetical protein